MPRQARLRVPGLPLHLVQRGHNKAPCFLQERDFRIYLSLVDQLSSLYTCAVHAYVLMTNHVHLLLTSERADGPSVLMKYLGQRFAQYFNRRYQRSGPLFEGRFRSCIVDSDAYLLACHRYIEMNPVRAGMVDHPSAYSWSSYRTNAEGCSSDFLVPHRLYLALADDPDERRRRYRSLFEVPEVSEELRRIREAVNSGTALARESFLDDFDEPTRIRATKRPRGRPARIAKEGVRSA